MVKWKPWFKTNESVLNGLVNRTVGVETEKVRKWNRVLAGSLFSPRWVSIESDSDFSNLSIKEAGSFLRVLFK